MAIHCIILALTISWTEEPGGLYAWGRKESDMTEGLTFPLQGGAVTPFPDPPDASTLKQYQHRETAHRGPGLNARKSPWKSNVLEMQNHVDMEKEKTAQHMNRGTLCGLMAKKTKSDFYLTPYRKHKLSRSIKDLCIQNKTDILRKNYK